MSEKVDENSKNRVEIFTRTHSQLHGKRDIHLVITHDRLYTISYRNADGWR